MAGVGAPWEAMGLSPERGKRGEGKRDSGAHLGAQLGGRHGGGLLCSCSSVCAALHDVHEVEGKKREKKKREKKKRNGKFSNPRNFFGVEK
jgi:hypothetical protein